LETESVYIECGIEKVEYKKAVSIAPLVFLHRRFCFACACAWVVISHGLVLDF